MDLHAGRNPSAVEHLRKAADRCGGAGLHGMGFVCLHGIGVSSNFRLGAEYFSQAVSMGHPKAMYSLGSCT